MDQRRDSYRYILSVRYSLSLRYILRYTLRTARARCACVASTRRWCSSRKAQLPSTSSSASTVLASAHRSGSAATIRSARSREIERSSVCSATEGSTSAAPSSAAINPSRRGAATGVTGVTGVPVVTGVTDVTVNPSRRGAATGGWRWGRVWIAWSWWRWPCRRVVVRRWAVPVGPRARGRSRRVVGGTTTHAADRACRHEG